MGIPSCYAGKILFVDLTQGRLREEVIPEQLYRDFIGGNGLGVRILYERMKARVDALGPENILGFVVGGLTGTAAPGSGRHMLVTKSPLTGTWAESNSGGTFGPELKTAGYDAVFFHGVSPRPVYLSITGDAAELKDAAELWGKDAYETHDLLQRMHNDTAVKTACIGSAGEAMSLLAGIVSERGRIAARNGVGAVMGAKKLKALAVKGGRNRIEPADPERFNRALRDFHELLRKNEYAKALSAAGTGNNISFLVSIGDAPLKNWRLSGLDALPTITNLDGANMDKYKVGSYGCYACPITCGAIIRQKEGPYAIRDEMHRPEYQTLAALGGMLMNDNLEAVIKANDICNRCGIDTVGVGGTMAMAMECYENGLISREDTGGIDLSWGNADAIVTLVEQIAKREGFGAALADGTEKAAERIGRGAEKYAVSIRGKSLAYHDPRMSPALGAANIADANPAHHMDSLITGMLADGASIGSDPSLKASKENPFEEYAIGSGYHQLLNASGMCSLYTVATAPPPLAELIAGAAGWDFGWKEALDAGRRILTLRQAFNAREGLTPDQFELPKRISSTTGIDYAALRNGYFDRMKWDVKTGKPSKEV
ncbi:MAG TPA: aldehyde ferredoxin oxidoreductase family protein, partial [Acidobacteriota bacterium]|nr:aldehyde ferredoxin oxidoreductase family protein [Acidobacteriota bacterium]